MAPDDVLLISPFARRRESVDPGSDEAQPWEPHLGPRAVSVLKQRAQALNRALGLAFGHSPDERA
jgi:hypothetical protein